LPVRTLVAEMRRFLTIAESRRNGNSTLSFGSADEIKAHATPCVSRMMVLFLLTGTDRHCVTAPAHEI
jgi:hypothetical protein